MCFRDEHHVDVMHAYVQLMNFTGLTVDEGIRVFLTGYRLPGEAQKIDRMMEASEVPYVICLSFASCLPLFGAFSVAFYSFRDPSWWCVPVCGWGCRVAASAWLPLLSSA